MNVGDGSVKNISSQIMRRLLSGCLMFFLMDYASVLAISVGKCVSSMIKNNANKDSTLDYEEYLNLLVDLSGNTTCPLTRQVVSKRNATFYSGFEAVVCTCEKYTKTNIQAPPCVCNNSGVASTTIGRNKIVPSPFSLFQAFILVPTRSVFAIASRRCCGSEIALELPFQHPLSLQDPQRRRYHPNVALCAPLRWHFQPGIQEDTWLRPRHPEHHRHLRLRSDWASSFTRQDLLQSR